MIKPVASKSGTSGNETPPTTEEQLSDLAVKIDRLKVLYEQYFMGIEKIEPTVARKEVTRAMLQLQQVYIRNTGLRFRFNTMLQKWNIYVTYWNRTLREIENGTYVRHVARARRAAEREGKQLPSEMLTPKLRSELDHDTDHNLRAIREPLVGHDALAPELERVEPLLPFPPAPPARKPVKPLPTVPGMSEGDLRALHKKFSLARIASGEPATVSFEALVNSLARQVPKVLEQPGVRAVRFDVAVQNGKAILKAFPQK
jgi:hypothetical protein